MVYILGIETTCDESGISLIEGKEKKVRILANELRSQVKTHSPFGGVVPILAAREHKKNLPILLKKIEKFFDLRKIDFLAFSVGPGLLPALVQGKEFVLNLAKKLNKKIYPINHLQAHFYSIVIKNKLNKWQKIRNIEFPSLVLVVSGGHTNMYFFENWLKFKKLGETIDDAAGESLDKGARILGLGYPGGPIIEKKAKLAKKSYSLPKPLLEKGLNFSFSGLKTAFLELVNDIKKAKGDLDEEEISALSLSLQKTIFEIILFKIRKAIKIYQPKSIVITGGVSANLSLRRMARKFLKNIKIYFPQKELSTDNGLNIAISGYILYLNKVEPKDFNQIDVFPREKSSRLL